MKMKRLALTLGPAFAATLLGACSTAPMMPDKAWTVEPVMTVRHGSQNAAGYYALGRHEENRPPPEKALKAYRKAVEADPGFVPAWNALGALHARLGQLEEALGALERAVKLAPAASHLHNNLGYALLLAGRDEAAATTLRRAVQIDGNNRRAWHNLADAYRRLGDESNAELAEAKANGTWPGEIHTPTPAAKPMPITTAQPKAGSPPVVGSASEPAPADQANSGTRLVKIAENVYELRTTPAAAGTPARKAERAVPAALAVSVAPVTSGVSLVSFAAPVTSAAPPASVAPAASSSRPVRYEVSNGHGRNGLARRIATLLQQDGMAFPRLTNKRPFNEPASVVQYKRGFREAAEALAARLPFRPTILETPSAGLVSDVRLLLGRDLTTSEACAELDLCPRVAAREPRPAVAVSAARERAGE